MFSYDFPVRVDDGGAIISLVSFPLVHVDADNHSEFFRLPGEQFGRGTGNRLSMCTMFLHRTA